MRVNYGSARPIRYRIVITIFISLYALAGPNRYAYAQNGAHDRNTARTDSFASPEAAVNAASSAHSVLPDAPAPAFDSRQPSAMGSSSLANGLDFPNPMIDASSYAVTPNSSERVPLSQCPYDKTGARECRVHWRQLMISASLYDAFQNAGNLYTGYWYRYETTTGKWFNRWIDSDARWRWNRWDDDNPVLDQYVGHPMMGSITNYLWIQDDPKGATLEIGNTPEYWRSRLRATLFSTAFSFQWKLGPFGEAAIGHNGDQFFHDRGGLTNETGWVELVTTPVGGLLWTMAEDELDKGIVKRLEEKPRGPVSLLFISFLTPSRATANVFRWRAPWYRDGRVVKAHSFWSDPPGPEGTDVDPGGGGRESSNAVGISSPSGSIAPGRNGEMLPLWPSYGGVHEFGAWWGLSLISGHIWGYAKDVKYMPIDLNYSYLFYKGTRMHFRYAPELTAVAMLDEPAPNPKLQAWEQRRRTYGSGLSPVGFRANFYPQSRVQPFLSTNGGFIYFTDRVLSPQGSQWMYTIDFGGGLQIFRKQRQAVTIGYRYQHLSNANISFHNPGTDTNVLYVAVSRFRTKGYR